MKDKKIRIIVIAVAIVVLATVGVYFFMKYQTYDYMEITETHENSSKDNANYAYCMDGILRYSRDGVALLSNTGEEKWNQPCQMNTPIADMNDESIVVADKGGTSILVFTEKGLKGEIKTTRPIEKVSVSTQGIVSAILKDEETPLVMCYDAKGEILVEHKVSINIMGYPIDIGLSEDGETLLVSYLNIEESKIVSKIAYYYFGEGGTQNKNNLILQREIEDTVVPTTAFLKKDISLIVMDNGLIFYKGLVKPEEFAKVNLTEEIQSVAYNDKIVAVVVKNGGEAAYKLHIYSVNGKELATVDFDKEYSQLKVVDNQILMYDGQMCSIFLKNGVHKYEGKMDENILEIFPLGGINKYMVINASGFHEVQLAK